MIRPFSIAILFAVMLLFGSNAIGQQPASMPQIAMKPSGDGVTIVRAKEDFSSLSLSGSDLHAEQPIVGDTYESPEFVRELVRLQWRPSDPIDVYVIRPRNVANPPVALYLYGFPSDTDRFRNDEYCKRLVHTGVAAVGFVSALTGQRIGNRALKQWFVSELQESLATSVHDVQMILNYLETRHDLDMSRVGMFGEGSGGAIAILAAEADTRIKVLDLLSPWADWRDWLAKSSAVPDDQRASFLKPAFLERLQPLEPLRYLPDLKSRRIRIQFKGDDTTVPAEVVSKIEFSVPAHMTVVHYSTTKEFWSAITGGRLFEWIAAALNPGAEIKVVSTVSEPN